MKANRRHPAARVASLLRAYVQAEEGDAFLNYWPLAEQPRPVALTDKNRGPMDREWRRADPTGFARFKRARAALRAFEEQAAALKTWLLPSSGSVPLTRRQLSILTGDQRAPQTFWTDNRLSLLLRMLAEEKTVAAVARRIGRSPEAVSRQLKVARLRGVTAATSRPANGWGPR